MTLTAWLSIASVCALGAITPGPSLAVVLRHTVFNSARHGVVSAVTHAAGIGLYALAAIWGLGALLERAPMVFQGLLYGGAVYLAWLGFKALRAGMQASQDDDTQATEQSAVEPLSAAARDGFAIVFFNPKIALFFTALFSQFISPDLSVLSIALMAGTVFVVDGLWYLLVALGVSRGPVLNLLRRNSYWLDRISGVVFILLALRVAIG